jgi:biotin carboxyl carrier protein
MEEIRSEIEGTVVTVDVEEGQMVAEEDVLVVVQASQGPVAVTTEVPGVVRELHVEPGHVIAPGDLLALIDES